MPELLSHRSVLSGVLAGWAAKAAHSAPSALPEALTVMVAGPANGSLAAVAAALSAPLTQALQIDAALTRQTVGGVDGVTGANRFEALSTPDGSTALLVPGLAALAWLGGDARVRFDAGQWVPLWGGALQTVVMSRVPFSRGSRIRLAVRDPAGLDLAVRLALDLMGVGVDPVQTGGRRGLGAVDVVTLRGDDACPAELAQLGPDWRPAFVLGLPEPSGATGRDPALPAVQTAEELFVAVDAEPSLPIHAAFRGVAAAAQLDCALVLPQPSPAAVVAWWRRGCETLAASPPVERAVADMGGRVLSPGPATSFMQSTTIDAPALLALRTWMIENDRPRPT